MISGPTTGSVVHVHVASDWSWRRKAQFIQQAQQHSMAVVIHLHSGAFATFLDEHPRQRTRLTKLSNAPSTFAVVLNDHWKDRFAHCVNDLRVVPNPVPENVGFHNGPRDAEHLLLLGRPDPVKGHEFAVNLVSHLRQSRPRLHLSMTGVENIEADGVAALGWVAEEEKTHLLNTCSALLVPSSFEGQPMVVIEALASGCPVVVSSTVPSPPEAVTVARHADQDAWVCAVNEVLGRPIDGKRLALSVDAHRIERVQRTWASVYGQALTRRTNEA